MNLQICSKTDRQPLASLVYCTATEFSINEYKRKHKNGEHKMRIQKNSRWYWKNSYQTQSTDQYV